jgi:AcrR family transcriptional regulator
MPKVVPEYKEQAIRRILEAAGEEFASRGYKETTMRDIAKRVGVSKAAVYQYFKSKEDLVGAVGNSLVDRLVESEFSARDQTLIQITEGAFERILDSTPSWFPQLMCDCLSAAHHDKEARRQVRDIDQKLVIAVSALWMAGKDAGEVPEDVDTEAVGRALVALSLGLLAFTSTGLPRSEAIEAWKETVRTMGRGMKPAKSQRSR